MSEGLREAFVENDVIGNYATGTAFLGSVATSSRRKKRKKHNRKVSNVHKRRKRHSRKSKHRRKKHHRASGGVKYTKNGRAYKVMPNGMWRFVKK